MVRDRADLEAVLAARRAGEEVVGALLASEGAHSLGADFRADLDAQFAQGLRMVSFTHFFDSAFAGSLDRAALPATAKLLADIAKKQSQCHSRFQMDTMKTGYQRGISIEQHARQLAT